MVQRARVQWDMGSSVLSVPFSVVLLVSVGGMVSTLRDELVGVFMACTLGDCTGEGVRGVVGVLTTCILVPRERSVGTMYLYYM